MGKDIGGYAQMQRRYPETDQGKFPGAYKPNQNVLALMADGESWWLAEIYEVRLSKYFDESDEEEEKSEEYYEEVIEHSEERDSEGNPVLYRDSYEMYDMSVMHECWQQQS